MPWSLSSSLDMAAPVSGCECRAWTAAKPPFRLSGRAGTILERMPCCGTSHGPPPLSPPADCWPLGLEEPLGHKLPYGCMFGDRRGFQENSRRRRIKLGFTFAFCLLFFIWDQCIMCFLALWRSQRKPTWFAAYCLHRFRRTLDNGFIGDFGAWDTHPFGYQTLMVLIIHPVSYTSGGQPVAHPLEHSPWHNSPQHLLRTFLRTT